MAFKIEDFFTFKTVSPSSLQQDNLISFSYKSPDGVNDKKPLVFVLEKGLDKIFGLNLHYDMGELQELIENIQIKVTELLEKEYYRDNPNKRKELREQRTPFNKNLLTEAEYKKYIRKIPVKNLEQFLLNSSGNSDNLRTYLYKRMNTVTKLAFKL